MCLLVRSGKWKGVTVAVKIVEHTAETEGELIQLRESLLSSSIVHPNVVDHPGPCIKPSSISTALVSSVTCCIA
jgi:hypothetical protein